MRRPAFTVVSSSVAALVLLGFGSRYLQPLIPKPVENQLNKEKSDFLSRAATQRIDWMKPVVEAFAVSRRRDLPILLFIGSSHNPLARAIDEGPLQSPRIQAFLARNFECIRVDTLDYPEYRNAFLPLSRGIIGIPAGCQLWVLDPSGSIVDLLPKNLAFNPTDENAFVGALIDARRRFESPSEVSRRRYTEAQQRDAETLLHPPGLNAPPFEEYRMQLVDSIYPRGGFRSYDSRTLVPEAWRYLLASGFTREFRSSIDPVLASPLVDLIDGGFFQGSRDVDWIEVDFDKSAIANADMLRTLASAWATMRDPVYKYLAERTFDSLSTEFALENGIAACRPSDSDKSQRSLRSSFGVRKLRESLRESADYSWAQENLGLRVETNPRMAPRLASPKTLEDPEQLERILALLRENAGKKPECTSPGFADVTGYTVARLIESARILGDPKRLERAAELFVWVEDNRQGQDVVHSPEPTLKTPYLGDYLGFADAALQHYLGTGRYASLLTGRQVLHRALELFAGTNAGTLQLGPARKPPFPSSLSLPEVSDAIAESTTAQAIRLCQDYGRIFNTDNALRHFANAATGNYGLAANLLGTKGAGFFLAAQGVFEDEFFVSVGPQAQEWADGLSQSHPFRLSLAAFGDIRADLKKRGPGVYLVRGEQVRGPVTPQQAAQRVSPFLGPGQ